ncbi:MAG: hypothetical protein ACOX45_04495 [Acutalibacteraceae bacterium]
MTSNRREREKAEAPPVADEARLSSEKTRSIVKQREQDDYVFEVQGAKRRDYHCIDNPTKFNITFCLPWRSTQVGDEAPLLRAMTSNRREREKAEAPPVADEARLSSEKTRSIVKQREQDDYVFEVQGAKRRDYHCIDNPTKFNITFCLPWRSTHSFRRGAPAKGDDL